MRLVADRAMARVEVRLDPPAQARVWLGPGRPFETLAVPGVVLGEGEVLVSVELATVCGSDVHTVRGDRDAAVPLVLGHEYVGRVVALGEGAIRDVAGLRLQVGERVVWSILAHCGTCDRCRRGLGQKCRSVRKYGHERIADGWELSGGFATHVHLRAGTDVVRVGEDLPGEVLAPLACGTATAWAALARAGEVAEVAGSGVLVSGAGLIGLTATAVASDRGAVVVVSDPDPLRRVLARRFGAVQAVDPADGPGAVRAAFEAHGIDEISIVIEASGAPSAVTAGLELAGVGGAVILVGNVFSAPPVPVDAEHLVRSLHTVRGVHNYSTADLAAASHWLLARGAAHPFASLVAVTGPLDELDALIELSATGRHVRVGIRPGVPPRTRIGLQPL